MNFRKLIKPYKNNLIADIKHLCSIPSEYDSTTISENAPYGKGIKIALEEFAKLGDMYGFDVDLNSRYVELSLGDKGPLIEVFGHLDVVPAQRSKDRNLYDIVIKDNKLYGRGVADDKGPLLASFYAIKALKDNGLIKNARIKIFAGGDEERGGSDLDYYINKAKKETPTYGFTPDGSFPLVYGEMGIGNLVIRKKIKLKHISAIKGGIANNVVIDKCAFVVDNLDEIKNKIKTDHQIISNEIVFLGAPAHGSKPELGVNAFLTGFRELGLLNNDEDMINIADMFLDYTGKKLGVFYNGKHLKETRFNVGIVNYHDGILSLTINYRYPENADIKKIATNITKKLGFTLEKENYSHPLLLEPSSSLVSSLLDAYQKETHDKTPPLTSPGGTYAKEVKNTIAFGAEFLDMPYKMHQEDEFIDIDRLMLTMRIYAHAIYNLINQDENKI